MPNVSLDNYNEKDDYGVTRNTVVVLLMSQLRSRCSSAGTHLLRWPRKNHQACHQAIILELHEQARCLTQPPCCSNMQSIWSWSSSSNDVGVSSAATR